jgi:hypothetical protein
MAGSAGKQRHIEAARMQEHYSFALHHTRKNVEVVTNLQQTCSNVVPTTCQQDVFALLVAKLPTACRQHAIRLLS